MHLELLVPQLLERFEGPLERIGFVLKSGEIVEVENVCEDPENGFDFRGEDLLRYMPEVAASWHTHPDQDSKLSPNDFYGFRDWPNWKHIIIGTDGVSIYEVKDGVVLNAS